MIRGQSAKLEKVSTKDMKKQEMVCMIRSDKKLKNNISGYSAMKKEDLKANLEKALNGEKPKPRAKPTQHKWNAALKKWNEQNASSGYLIPKKGTKEYDQVKKLMSGEQQVATSSRANVPFASAEPSASAKSETKQVAKSETKQPEKISQERKAKATMRNVVEPTGPAVRKSTRSRVKPIRFADEETT